MSVKTVEKPNIEANELLIVERKDPEAGGKFNKEGYVIRVVEWIYDKKDGSKGSSVALEKRGLFIGSDGTTKNGKAKGFTKDDLGKIQQAWDGILAAMS